MNNASPKYQTVDKSKATVQPLSHGLYDKKKIQVDVFRLDLIHPVIAGNKWFKLQYHLKDAMAQQRKGIVTAGGAYSNHLVATAAACRETGLACIGMVRGERPPTLSPTLEEAIRYGMRLRFIPREIFDNEQAFVQQVQQEFPDHAFIPQGGQGAAGVKGAAEILRWLPNAVTYTHIACAVGTGTMMAGILTAATPQQKIIGVSSLKIPNTTDNSFIHLLQHYTPHPNFVLWYDYHFGGYAKKTPALLDFMNALYHEQALPTDFVYTGKLLYAVTDQITKDYFPPGSRLMVIHSGGLQGNRSLPPGTLLF